MSKRRTYVKPTIKKLEIDNQTSMILQSPPIDPPISLNPFRFPF